MEKIITILANSTKKGAHCIAGVVNEGNWIRPVSTTGEEGELSTHQICYSGRSEPQILDKVKIKFSSHATNKSHPEDYFITDSKWELLNSVSKTELKNYVDFQHDLWYQKGVKSDRISNSQLLLRNPINSICLIEVESYTLRYSKIYDTYNKYNKKKRLIDFKYQGRAFTLSFTDPIFSKKYCPIFPDVGQPEKCREFATPAYFCISLTPELNGYHYKIIATIIE